MLKKLINRYRDWKIIKKFDVRLSETNSYARKIGRNCFEIHINRSSPFTFSLKDRRPLSPEAKILSFDYFLSSHIWKAIFLIGKHTSLPFRSLHV